jgi:hypothetical protein
MRINIVSLKPRAIVHEIRTDCTDQDGFEAKHSHAKTDIGRYTATPQFQIIY